MQVKPGRRVLKGDRNALDKGIGIIIMVSMASHRIVISCGVMKSLATRGIKSRAFRQ